MRLLTMALTGVFAAGSTMAWADSDRSPPPVPQVLQSVLDCEAVTEPQARLACFDRSVAELASASKDRQVLVVDRETMRETRRGVFGLGLPSLKLFSGGDSEEVTSIDSTITGLRTASDGMPIFVLEDGARWKQTEGRNVYPKVGNPIHIKRAAMGSFMANVDKQPGVRVVRLAN